MRIEEIKRKLSDVDSKLEKLQHEREAWLTAIAVYERCKIEPIGEFPESAYRSYIIAGTVADAAYMLNSSNQRNGTKKFTPNDISATIDSIDIEDTEVMNVARFLLSNGRKFINFLFN